MIYALNMVTFHSYVEWAEGNMGLSEYLIWIFKESHECPWIGTSFSRLMTMWVVYPGIPLLDTPTCLNHPKKQQQQQPTTNNQQPTNNKQQPTTNNQQTTTNKQQTTTNNQQPTNKNNKQQTTNNKQQTTSNKQQTTNNHILTFTQTVKGQTIPARISRYIEQ